MGFSGTPKDMGPPIMVLPLVEGVQFLRYVEIYV